ncbi:hypothetical protein CH333_08240 [candidate division WOR-3 bacterium JGI_Cruoil_03_44_89]|uniref:Glycosidase n=1 Tax=candidate division WOR-3 bacterium JGI_Cruoil_03_44_89 TaxID=1973748 RepID=A0A235BPD4_UNCW3|nr:MAG: hypothetical protein CH333_08240 [candidate division WOR-3 bacterium JGI_Cruoil_03_44_89]
MMLVRFKENPILEPIKTHPWEAKMVFNTAAIYLGGKVHLLYRAGDIDDISTIGYASSKDGFRIDERLETPVLAPQSEEDCFGCEDPRITKIGERLYITYTAYGRIPGMEEGKLRISPRLPQIGMTSISVEDFLNHRWNFSERIYPLLGVENKDCVIFSEKFGGRYVIYHRVSPYIWICYSDDLVHWYDHNILMGPEQRWEHFKIGAGAPPIKTEKGWLFIFHGVSNTLVYSPGFAFIDLEDPRKVIYRHPEPILEPTMKYEKEGVVPNVVFVEGVVIKDETVFVYYGGADTVIGVATAPLSRFFELAGL